jgi:hypothetical protein
MKETAIKIKELNAYLDKNPWDISKRQERITLIEQLCNMVIESQQ